MFDEKEFKVEGDGEASSLEECYQLAWALKKVESQLAISYLPFLNDAISKIVDGLEGIND
jgi:hypothetical protein